MIITPEKIILNKEEGIYQKSVFLISGNEETYINKIKKIISIKVFENKDKEVTRVLDGSSINKKIIDPFLSNLFHQFKVLVFNNPKDIDFEYLKNIDTPDLAIIICIGGQKNQNKIKKNFEKEENSVVINCYKLNREVKKKYFEDFLQKNSLDIDKEAYWFFLENVSDYYQLFENEMLKLLSANLEKASIDDIRSLLVFNENHEIEKLFFLILKKPREIMLQTSRAINSEADGYVLLQRVRFFINLLIQFKTINEVTNFFPKYLFKEKPLFLVIFNKVNRKKLTEVFILIKKTEIILRKQPVFYAPVCERFMINLSRAIK